jgi:hypothetical protein
MGSSYKEDFIKLQNEKKLELKNKNIKKMGGSYKEDFIKSQNEKKLELNNLIENNKLKLITELEKINEMNNPNSTENINNNISKKISLKNSILNKFSNFKFTYFYLFIIKIVICVFILPLIKNNFNIQDSFNDMLRNLFQTIFKIEFFKKNFTSISVFLDKLGDFYKPYKYLKKLLEELDEKNEKQSSNLLKKCFHLFFNYNTISKISVIVNMYKNKDTLFRGNSIERTTDIISLISSLLTLFEIVICPKHNHSLCKYISPWNNISIYLLFFITSIDMALLIYSQIESSNPENKRIIQESGYFTLVLFILCSNINFYKEGQIITPIINRNKQIQPTIQENNEINNSYLNEISKDVGMFFKIQKVMGAIISNRPLQIGVISLGTAYGIRKLVIEPSIDKVKKEVDKTIDETIDKVENKVPVVIKNAISQVNNSLQEPYDEGPLTNKGELHNAAVLIGERLVEGGISKMSEAIISKIPGAAALQRLF